MGGGEFSIVVLVKDGAVLPQVQLAQSTAQIDWSTIKLVSYATNGVATGKVYLPNDSQWQEVSVLIKGKKTQLLKDPYNQKVKWNCVSFLEK
jgi:alpha-D-xyloside xylohydrolase